MRVTKLWCGAAIVCLLILVSSSCLVRRRVVTRQGKNDTRPLLTATKQQLIDRIRAIYDPIKSFNATMDMTPALGSVYKGEISEFPGVRGYVLFEKPDKIRIIGLDPVIRTKAFDMVSVGQEFKLFLPSKSRFVVGRNDAPTDSKNKMENLRPDAFLHAILIYPPNDETEVPVLEDDTDEEHSFYILLILSRQQNQLALARAVYFDRLTLNIVRQKGFDRDGSTISDTRYSDWKTYNNIAFPDTIDINRPVDGYGVVMKTVKVLINGELKAEQFELAQPENTKLHVIGEPAPPSPGKE